ncbi:sorting nexin-10B isoform X2 [Heterodontus francisci]|uniref:sorting nexin-10B isoform X2 n=1 Tax=Heterodontus francisci TaxID=7792 RepID=UPI00355C8B98
MEEMIKDKGKEFISVWVRDPRIKKEDSWHSYVDYEICVHTNSMCFTKKTSCVRRRYREFAWLKQRLQDNAALISVPEFPSKNPFFSANNAQLVEQRRQGLQEFLEKRVSIVSRDKEAQKKEKKERISASTFITCVCPNLYFTL